MLRVDWLDYAERLLGAPEWCDPAGIAALMGKAQALLPSDIIALPVMRVAAAHIAGRAGLHSAVAAKPGGAAPLKVLLADERLAAGVNETLVRLAAAAPGVLLALELPAPAAFAQGAAVAAGLPAPAANEDLADDAAVYVAAFLRNFVTAPVGALLIGEDAAFAEFNAPVLKVAAHYGWQVPGTASSRHSGEGRNPAAPHASTPESGTQLGSGLRRNDGIRTFTIPADTRPEDAAALVAEQRAAT